MSPFGKDVPLSLTDLQQGINNLFDQVWHAGIRTGPFDGQDWAPPVDLIEKADRYILEAELPGLCASDVEVTCSGNEVTIKGQKTRSGSKDEDDRMELAERRYGSFCREVRLPDTITAAALTARFDKGILIVEVPREHPVDAQQVKIEISE